jgi:hypothetical protein
MATRTSFADATVACDLLGGAVTQINLKSDVNEEDGSVR